MKNQFKSPSHTYPLDRAKELILWKNEGFEQERITGVKFKISESELELIEIIETILKMINEWN